MLLKTLFLSKDAIRSRPVRNRWLNKELLNFCLNKELLNFCLETDSKLVLLAFSNHSIVPWHLRNIWLNNLSLTRSKIFIFVSHVYREGNSRADRLTKLTLELTDNSIIWWNEVPQYVKYDYIWNRQELPSYRFIYF